MLQLNTWITLDCVFVEELREPGGKQPVTQTVWRVQTISLPASEDSSHRNSKSTFLQRKIKDSRVSTLYYPHGPE